MTSNITHLTPFDKRKQEELHRSAWFTFLTELVFDVIRLAVPPLRHGEMITQRQLMWRMGINSNTLNRWIQAGLNRYVRGTKQFYYDTTEVIAFIKKEQEELPDYLPQYQKPETD